MPPLILYGSHYGTSKAYAEALGKALHAQVYAYKSCPKHISADEILYVGGIYAGRVVGLKKTVRHLPKDKGLTVVTVGISDPALSEDCARIVRGLQKELPESWFQKVKIFHLRGGLDYPNMHKLHSLMMGMMVRSLKKKGDRKTPEDNMIIETYQKHVDFVDFGALLPIIAQYS